MRIKKHPNKNQYYLSEDNIWVRDFTRLNTANVDINTSNKQDFDVFFGNEITNRRRKYPRIDNEHLSFESIIIVSDGYNFNNLHRHLAEIPYKTAAIFAVNGALKKWDLIKNDPKRSINYYVLNNPFTESLSFLPKTHRYFPPCIASSRTYPEFLECYPGDKYLYIPAYNNYYKTPFEQPNYYIDDYRNAICAAIGLAYRCNVRRLLMFCCDDVFKDERPAAIQLENGLWTYPQQMISHNLINSNLYWLKTTGVSIGMTGHGPKFVYSEYINESLILDFLKGKFDGQ